MCVLLNKENISDLSCEFKGLDLVFLALRRLILSVKSYQKKNKTKILNTV